MRAVPSSRPATKSAAACTKTEKINRLRLLIEEDIVKSCVTDQRTERARALVPRVARNLVRK